MLRLFIAIVISVLLHFFWLKAFHWELPKNKTDTQVIDARLVPIKPTPVKQKAPPKEIIKKPLPKPEPAKPKVVKEVAKLSPLPPPYVAPDLNEQPPVVDEKVDVPIIDTDEVIDTPVEPLRDSSLEQADLPKVTPYQYIETVFDIYLNDDKARAGKAKITYDATELGQYKLDWTVEASGLLALFYPNLVQTSEGSIDAAYGLRPSHYRYQFGNKENKSYQAAFNWDDGQLLLHSSKGDKTVALTPNAQDYLSFMYQFMYKPPLNTMQISLTNGKRLASYNYSFEGEETLKLDFGEVKTYHIKHAKSDSDEKTELWLAVDYQFIPVKISKTEKDGKVINQIATTINTKSVQPTQELPLP
jgi:hypothetical protein